MHTEVLDPLHVLLAIALELPEDFFTNLHKYELKSEDHLRYMKYTKYTPEENLKIGKLWVQGHTGMVKLVNRVSLTYTLQILAPGLCCSVSLSPLFKSRITTLGNGSM